MKKKIYVNPIFIIILCMLILFAGLLALALESEVTVEKAEAAGLPILFIETEHRQPVKSKETYIDAVIKIGLTEATAKIRGRGNSTWEQAKKPYLLKLDSPQEILGMKSARKWVLLANNTDNTHLRNAFATYLARNVFTHQAYIPDYRFVSLFMNGKYDGIYQIYEKIEISENRLDIEPNGSFCVVTNTRDSREVNFRTKLKNVGFSLYDPDEPSKKQAEHEIAYINHVEEVLFSDSFKNPADGYRSLIDMDSFIDWYWINEFTTNRDARMRDSCYFFYNAADGKLHAGPIWDFDISCGNNSYPDNVTTGGYWIRTKADWFARLFEDEFFKERVEKRYHEARPLLGDATEWISETAESLRKAAEYNNNTWRTIGRFNWPHATGWQSRKTYNDEVQYFIEWVESRIKWLDNDIVKTEAKK